MKSLSDTELYVLHDVLDDVGDKLNHYTDGEMGWDESEVAAFWSLKALVDLEAKLRKFWWAV